MPDAIPNVMASTEIRDETKWITDAVFMNIQFNIGKCSIRGGIWEIEGGFFFDTAEAYWIQWPIIDHVQVLDKCPAIRSDLD